MDRLNLLLDRALRDRSGEGMIAWESFRSIALDHGGRVILFSPQESYGDPLWFIVKEQDEKIVQLQSELESLCKIRGEHESLNKQHRQMKAAVRSALHG